MHVIPPSEPRDPFGSTLYSTEMTPDLAKVSVPLNVSPGLSGRFQIPQQDMIGARLQIDAAASGNVQI